MVDSRNKYTYDPIADPVTPKQPSSNNITLPPIPEGTQVISNETTPIPTQQQPMRDTFGISLPRQPDLGYMQTQHTPAPPTPWSGQLGGAYGGYNPYRGTGTLISALAGSASGGGGAFPGPQQGYDPTKTVAGNVSNGWAQKDPKLDAIYNALAGGEGSI